jgi:hypothetical protein
MSSTSFVDLPFEEHRMMENHHLYQNPCISSLCTKDIVTDNMTRGDDVAQSPMPTEPKDGRPTTPPWPIAHGLASLQNPSSTRVNLSRQEGYPMWERWCCHKAWSPGQVKWQVGLTSGPPEPQFWPRHSLNPPINTLILLPAEGVKKVRFSLL